MTDLLKYFVTLSIGHKDFSIVEECIANLLIKEGAEEFFHIEPAANNLYKIWKLESWKQIQEGRVIVEKARQEQIKEYEKKYNNALAYLTGSMSEADAKEMLEMPQIKAKFGL